MNLFNKQEKTGHVMLWLLYWEAKQGIGRIMRGSYSETEVEDDPLYGQAKEEKSTLHSFLHEIL